MMVSMGLQMVAIGMIAHDSGVDDGGECGKYNGDCTGVGVVDVTVAAVYHGDDDYVVMRRG